MWEDDLDYEDDPDDGAMPCGCIDYHMADCPIITERGDYPEPPEPDEDGPFW